MSQVVDTFGCLNNTIKVAAGHYVDLVNPDPSTIEIKSIAKALSRICRFGSHCPNFYSVAEHCFHATGLASNAGWAGDALQAVFLHDAAEAYIGDMVKPLKLNIPQYMEFEKRIESAIEIKFGVHFSRWSEVIKRFDRAMLKAEKTSMWPDDKEKWEGFADIEDFDVVFQCWDPRDAEEMYLLMAKSVGLVS